MKLCYSILVSLTTSIILSLSLTSCDNDKPGKDYGHHSSIQNKVESETKTIKKDSLETIQTQIEDLSQQIEGSSDDIKKLESSVKELDGLLFWKWLLLGIGGLAILLSLIAINKGSSLKREVEKVDKSVQQIKSELRNDAHQPQQVSRNNSSNEVEQLERRVRELGNQLRQLLDDLNSNKSTSPIPDPIVPSPQQQVKKGYFANPINGAIPYFKKLLQDKAEARFSVEISNNKAIFRPLEGSDYFNTYISFIEDYRAAIEFSGCDPKQATRMQIIKGGDAELRDGNWCITKKALVNLS